MNTHTHSPNKVYELLVKYRKVFLDSAKKYPHIPISYDGTFLLFGNLMITCLDNDELKDLSYQLAKYPGDLTQVFKDTKLSPSLLNKYLKSVEKQKSMTETLEELETKLKSVSSLLQMYEQSIKSLQKELKNTEEAIGVIKDTKKSEEDFSKQLLQPTESLSMNPTSVLAYILDNI
ncbi:MAG: hypothetical protein R3321_08300 [Nitrososphaeraceae archaeon]|nr:hypothetical protein [Nitrososphaeraceae archaeon]